MALTAEQTTAQNFKDFYDRIRPLLNAQHYHVDRSGQELKCGDYNIQGNPTIPVGLSQNTHLTLTARGGQHPANFTIENGNIIIPEGMTVNIASNMVVNNNGSESETNSLFMIYDYKNSANIGYASAVYHGNGVARTGSYIYNYTAPSGGAEIGLKCTYNAVAARTVGGESGLTITEIGRIVDPVQYVSSGDNLEETPVGNIISYMGNNVPPHYLACDGSEHAIGTYPELEAHFIAEFGSVNYFGGDGTYMFAVPDLRGEFLRGTGTNSHTNQGSGANVGMHQDGTATPSISAGYDGLYINNIPASGTNGNDNIDSGYKKNASNRSASVNIAGTWSTTADNMVASRPTNTSVQYCIKYESTYHVIVPSHAYKVSVPFSVKPTSAAQIATLDTTNIKGDSSLINGGNFVAPIAGWYICSGKSSQYNWTSGGDGRIVCYWRINGESTSGGTYADCSTYTNSNIQSINFCSTVYLNKGDTINLYVYGDNGWTNTTFEGDLDFCLLTSNVHENIIAGGEVYSETEQVIGTWTDGKPLYQKTINFGSLPNAIEKRVLHNISNIDKIVRILGIYNWDDEWGSFDYSPNDTTNIGYGLGFGVDSTNIIVRPKLDMSNVTESYVTLQYTKTTDVANTYTYKNSLLLTRPDQWPENTEIDFGGGLYGYRIAGLPAASITAASDTWTTLADIGLGLSQAAKMMSCGGYVGVYSTSGGATVTPLAQPRGDSFRSGLYFSVAGNLRLNAKSPAGSQLSVRKANDSLDVWCTYKK